MKFKVANIPNKEMIICVQNVKRRENYIFRISYNEAIIMGCKGALCTMWPSFWDTSFKTSVL